MGTVNVALLEHSDFRTATRFVKRAFQELGHEVDITELRVGTSAVEGPKSIFAHKPIDVFASDISLGRTSSTNFEGLAYIQRVKLAYPDVFAIGISQHEVTYYAAGARLPSFDLFVQKDLVDDDTYLKHTVQVMRRTFRRNVSMRLNTDGSMLLKEHASPAGRVKLERILRAVTFTTHSTPPMTDVASASLRPLEEGRSASDVYRMDAFTSSGLQCINAVLKLSRPPEARREIDNYRNYVKWYLPYTWRVEQLGTAMLNDVGAICYSFAYNDERPFKSAAQYMRDRRHDELQNIVHGIFRRRHQRWYHENNVNTEDGDLKQYYQRRWFEGRGDAEEILRSTLRAFDQSERNSVSISGVRYSMPRGFFLGTPWGTYKSCIRHGDLHGGNVLISAAGEFAFIDFQETGRGHVFEDFVTFEGSIRLNYNAELPVEQLISGEVEQFAKGESRLPYSHLVGMIRGHALDNFPTEAPLSYAFAFGLYCYRLLRIRGLAEWQRDQLVAGTMAAVRHLMDSRSIAV